MVKTKTKNKVNFELGRTVSTSGASVEIETIATVRAGIDTNAKPTMGDMIRVGIEKQKIIRNLIKDHQNLVQGLLDKSDHELNAEACATEGQKDANGNLMQTRIFSAFKIKDIKFWVITEWDRSVTTILLPSEY